MKQSFRDLARPLARMLRGPIKVPVAEALARGLVADCQVDNRIVRWLINNRADEFLLAQRQQGFAELAELRQLGADVGPVETVLDVGANVGNHALYFALFMGARSLTLVEPFAEAADHLLANFALNGPELRHFALHRLALGAARSTAALIPPSEFNIGLTRVDEGSGGTVPVIPGDDLRLERVDLIKIDVEGGEIGVLQGLRATLAAHRPALYVEVGASTRQAVTAMLAELGYLELRAIEAHQGQSNITFVAA